MQRKRITGRGVPRQRRKPCNDLWSAAEVQPGRSQRRHMQRLADMARIIGPIRVLMEERSTRRKEEQRSAGQQRQRPARVRSSENGFPRMHLSTRYRSRLDERTTCLVAYKSPHQVKALLDRATIPA